MLAGPCGGPRCVPCWLLSDSMVMVEVWSSVSCGCGCALVVKLWLLVDAYAYPSCSYRIRTYVL